MKWGTPMFGNVIALEGPHVTGKYRNDCMMHTCDRHEAWDPHTPVPLPDYRVTSLKCKHLFPRSTTGLYSRLLVGGVCLCARFPCMKRTMTSPAQSGSENHSS